jgi:hypothetical protein
MEAAQRIPEESTWGGWPLTSTLHYNNVDVDWTRYLKHGSIFLAIWPVSVNEGRLSFCKDPDDLEHAPLSALRHFVFPTVPEGYKVFGEIPGDAPIQLEPITPSTFRLLAVCDYMVTYKDKPLVTLRARKEQHIFVATDAVPI